MGQSKSSTRAVLAKALIVALVMFFVKAVPAETVKVSGHGQAAVPTVKKAKDQAAANVDGLQAAEILATNMALSQAVVLVLGGQDALGSRTAEIQQAVLNNSAGFILDKQITASGVQGNSAAVDLTLQIDAKALRDFLDANYHLNAVSDTEGKFKIYVLSYTLEGMDPDRSGPPRITHEETVDNQKAVHDSTFADSDVENAKRSASASLAASKADTAKGNQSASASASLNSSLSAQQAGNSISNVNAHDQAAASANASANWDNTSAASVDARRASAASQSSSVQHSGSKADDTSRYYHRVVDYADPSKKGTALSNEVRADLEGMMSTLGFDVATLNVGMMGRDFPSEDDLINEVLDEMRHNPEVLPSDYVVIALNSFTSVSTVTHQFTSKVTYRVVRVKDGLALVPAKDLVGDSGDRAPSDDVARTYAVKAAMLSIDDIVPGEIKQAMQKLHRAEVRNAQTATTTFLITLDNATAFSASAPIRTALVNAGYKVDQVINGPAKTHILTVTLAGKTGPDVTGTIQTLLDQYEIESMDDHEIRIKVKDLK